MRSAQSGLGKTLTAVLLTLLTIYRFTLGPLIAALFGGGCRFHPSCSAYATEAIRTYGGSQGTRMAVKRVVRCRPGGGFGYDPVTPRSSAVEMS